MVECDEVYYGTKKNSKKIKKFQVIGNDLPATLVPSSFHKRFNSCPSTRFLFKNIYSNNFVIF